VPPPSTPDIHPRARGGMTWIPDILYYMLMLPPISSFPKDAGGGNFAAWSSRQIKSDDTY